MVSIKDGDEVMSVKYAVANESGAYSVTFPEVDWKPGCELIVSTYHNGTLAENVTTVTEYAYQSVNVRLGVVYTSYGGLGLVIAVASVVLLVAVAAIRKRNRGY